MPERLDGRCQPIEELARDANAAFEAAGRWRPANRVRVPRRWRLVLTFQPGGAHVVTACPE
jgi:hypothetical protein